MRYYQILLNTVDLTDPNTPVFGVPRDNTGQQIGPFKSTINGGFNPGALQIELDISQGYFGSPNNGSFLKIWGVGLPAIASAANLNPAKDLSTFVRIQVYAGMDKGLPLATLAYQRKQQGLIVDGMVAQSFGIWQGLEQSLNIFLQPTISTVPGLGTDNSPKNLVFNCPKGMQLGEAAANTLNVVYPNATVFDLTSQKLVMPWESGIAFWPTMDQFARYLFDTSRAIINDPTGVYQGVQIYTRDGNVYLDDGTSQVVQDATQIYYEELIGQPTWKDIATINFKAVMRADLALGQLIQMPKTPVVNGSNSYNQFRDSSTFAGVFNITEIRHIGNFRQANGDSWVSSITAVAASI